VRLPAARPALLLWSAAAALALLASPSPGQRQPPWPDALLTRTQALALVQGLNAEILASRSATASLEGWCRDHRLAAEPRIVAEAVPGESLAPTPEQRARLGVDSTEPVRYRRVRLRCGAVVLSEAENWYVPGRLTAEMNRALEGTQAPFGRVVAPLEPYRRTFLARLLWSPLPAGWELARRSGRACAGAGTLRFPAALFEHRAVLYASDGRPISEVHEVYQRGLLAFPAPGPC
jgi:chorismate-pyruvate lyase